MISDSYYSLGEVEALSDEFIELVSGKGFGYRYLFVLAHEFQLDLVHLNLYNLSIIISTHHRSKTSNININALVQNPQ